jgi:hypothetical protein
MSMPPLNSLSEVVEGIWKVLPGCNEDMLGKVYEVLDHPLVGWGLTKNMDKIYVILCDWGSVYASLHLEKEKEGKIPLGTEDSLAELGEKNIWSPTSLANYNLGHLLLDEGDIVFICNQWGSGYPEDDKLAARLFNI